MDQMTYIFIRYIREVGQGGGQTHNQACVNQHSLPLCHQRFRMQTTYRYINEFITQKQTWNIPTHFDQVARSLPKGHMTRVGVGWGISWPVPGGLSQLRAGISCECVWLLWSVLGTTYPLSPGCWCHQVCSDDQWMNCVPWWQSWGVFHLCVLGTWCPAFCLTNVFLVTLITLGTVYHPTLFFFL